MIESTYRVPPRRANVRGRGTRNWRFPMRPDSSTREIVLADGRVAVVDAADYELVSRWKWYYHGKGYAIAHSSGRANWRMVFMHRLLLLPEPDQHIDHVNGNGLDNRRANLRLCTRAQNNANARSRGQTSRYKGVCWDQQRSSWSSKTCTNGRTVNLGRFLDEIDAARAYDAAAASIFGPFARLNFPLDDGGM